MRAAGSDELSPNFSRSDELSQKSVASDLVVEKTIEKVDATGILGGYLVADESQNGDALSEAEDATSLDSEDGGRSTHSPPNYIGQLAEEILLAIFRYALPPSGTVRYHNTLPPFPRTGWSNADLPTKLVMMSVCKTWNHVGLEFLYESVALHSYQQLHDFVGALGGRMVEGASGVGLFVRRLEIGYWVPHPYRALHEAELGAVIALCPRLTHFAFTPQLLSGLAVLRPKFPYFAPNPRNSVLVHLEISDGVPYTEVFPALAQLAPTLESLSMLLPVKANSSVLPEEHGRLTPMLNFARLTCLRLSIGHQDPTCTCTPALTMDFFYRRLSVADTLPPSAPLGSRLPLYHHITRAFLEEYGRTVQRGPLFHAGLRSVDVFGPSPAFDSGCLNLKTAFPALCAYRYIFNSRCYNFLPDLPQSVDGHHDEDAAVLNSHHILSEEESDTLPCSSCLEYIFSDACADKDDEDDVDYVFDEAEEDSEEEDLDVDLDCSIANDPLTQRPSKSSASWLEDLTVLPAVERPAAKWNAMAPRKTQFRPWACRASEDVERRYKFTILGVLMDHGHRTKYTTLSTTILCRGEKQRNSPHTISKKAYWGHGPSKAQNRDF
ncbi:hypothetical protein B0H14DRAFT_3716380 [Mycena olivaceomarginata]|nr:hypothetical protein B0H14DRAFT_3716380 [Mycena olivaceomarginata]